MPTKDKDRYNTYMREYMLNRYVTRMANLISRFGGKCKECGGTKNLQFHHRDPKSKTFTIAGSMWNASQEKLEEEVEKCDLLCENCHKKKHSAKDTHGTISSYRYCHCEICKEANRKYTTEYRKTHPRKRMRS